MRTTIDLSAAQLAALRELERSKNISRAELVRQAVAEYLLRHAETTDAFGAWKITNRQQRDGLTVQKKLRTEWAR